MANVIKYSTTIQPNTIKSGPFVIGVNQGGYGSTSTTGYRNGKTPNVGGYVVYQNTINSSSVSPPFYIMNNDTELINFVLNLGGYAPNIGWALIFMRNSGFYTCANMDYPNIVTDGLKLNLDAGYVASYPKIETTWTDISGNFYAGTLINGPTYSSDGGGCIVLDGIDDYINVSSPQTLNPGSSSFTIDCWLKQNDLGYNGIVEARGTSLHGFLFILNYPSGGYASFFLNTTDDAGQNVYVSSTNGFTSTTTWINATVVIDRASSIIKFYNNGIQEGSNINITSGGSVDPGSGYRYEIGSDLGGPEMNGNIATLKQYNRALSSDEVLQNYYAGLQRLIPTGGLVLYLDGNNTDKQVLTPTISNDISGNNNNGTLINGVTLARDGQRSFSFDGTDDYMNVTHNTSQNLTSQGTISAWINPAVLTQGWYANIVAKNTGGSVNQQSYTLSWRQVSGGLFGQICDGIGTYNDVYGSFPTVANVWYNIVFTWNGSQLVMYNNGVAVGTTTQTINNQVLSTDLTIGGYTYKGAGGGDEYFNGKIGQVRIYNVGLTATQVSTIYTATKSRYGY